MGIRGEIFSTKVILQNRSYFFNVKENRLGDLYLNIVESKNRETGGFDRQSVILFADDLQEFLRGFDESLRVLEKAVREKRRVQPAAAKAPSECAADKGRGAGGKRLVVKKGRKPNSAGKGPAAAPPGKAVIRRPRKKD
ncbi:MAG: DUF3276 family protein [Treponema sp.]|jgi:hypothetical protein|nr:DUF3276 family protein [Treponema sp.]